MPRKLKLTDKLRKFFNFGSRSDLDDLQTPTFQTPRTQLNISDPSASSASSFFPSARPSPVPSPSRHSSVSPVTNGHKSFRPSSRAQSGDKIPVAENRPPPGPSPVGSQESGSTNPTRSLPMEEAAAVFSQSSKEQKRYHLKQAVHLLAYGTDDQKSSAAELVFNYASDDEFAKETLAELGVVKTLVHTLRGGSTKGKMYAAHTLATLTALEPLRTEMLNVDAIPALVSVLSDSSRLESKKGAMRALGKLSKLDDDACIKIVECRGLPPMINLLGSSDSSLVRRCLIALYFIGADKSQLQLEIANAGAIPRILNLCKSDTVEVQAEAVDVLKMLARNFTCGQVIAKHEGISVLGQLAIQGTATRVSQAAVRAIARLYENPQLKQLLHPQVAGNQIEEAEQEDEVKQLVKIVTTGDKWIREQAVQAIGQAAADDPIVSKELADSGVLDPLLQLLRNGTQKEQLSAARTLGNMVKDPYVRSKLVKAGAVPLLSAAIFQHEVKLQEASMMVMQRLLENVEAAAGAAADARFVPALMHLLQTSMTANMQCSCLCALQLVCHSQGSAKLQLLEKDGVPLLVHFCWQRDPHLQLVAANILHDLAAHDSTHVRLIKNGGILALCALKYSPHREIADVSIRAYDSLIAAAEQGVAQTVQAEEQLQLQITGMLDMVKQRVGEMSPRVERAFRTIPRGYFISDEQVNTNAIYSDRVIPMSSLGINMPAPHVEALALESLQLEAGHSFLEGGSGSGFLTCLAAFVQGSAGSALGVELDPAVFEYANKCSNVVGFMRPCDIAVYPRFRNASIVDLLNETEKFDRVMISVACPRVVLQQLISLLKPQGRMVAPCDGDLLLIHQETGLQGAEVLSRNVPYRALCMSSPHNSQPDSIVSPSEADSIPSAHFHSGGTQTPTSPNPSTQSPAGLVKRQASSTTKGGDAHQMSRIPARSRPQETPNGHVSAAPGAPASSAASNGGTPRRRAAAADVRPSQRQNGGGAASTPRHRVAGVAGVQPSGGSKTLMERMDSHNEASSSGMDHGQGLTNGNGTPRARAGVAGRGGSVRRPSAEPHAPQIQQQQQQPQQQQQQQPAQQAPAVRPLANGVSNDTESGDLNDPGRYFAQEGVKLLKIGDIQICRNGEGKKCRLGEGGFGVVYKAMMNNVDEVAVKLVKNESPNAKEIDTFTKEVAILSRLHHRNIVQFYGACLKPGQMFFVTELMKGGDLYAALRNHPETMRWEHLGKKVALDVALGINYLHSQKPPMMHRDLKSPNVLLSEEGVAKIADVGMVRAQVKELVTAQPVMTPLWAAPEVMRHERASIKADIWSYGILIWELVSGEDITEYQPLASTMQLGSRQQGGKVIQLPPNSPLVAKQLFHACCQLEPDRRPTAQELVEWLRNDRGE